MSQFQQLLTTDNFKLAFYRIKVSTRSLYKSIYYEDLKIFELYLNENIETTINLIKQDIYKPEKCYKIYIPKKDNLVRPLSMLTFTDLLIYQAIINIIATKAYGVISPYYDHIIFGNVLNPVKEENEFFFKGWKKKWKKFNEVSKQHFNKGYIYLSEFDIASFFDTIDHNILCEILSSSFKIEKKILKLLSNCLATWTADQNYPTFQSKHGIPQGPISSNFIADLYLFYLDLEIKKLSKLDFKYVRYVDDIRIFSKSTLVSQKLIAALDLLSRDLGLIPQGNKILIKKIENIDSELKVQNSKFSEIVKEYNEENEGKPSNSLKSKTHRRLKERFLKCFEKDSSEQYLDKTVIGFSLYKLNKDEEIKDILLTNYKLILPKFDGVLFYFRKHFNGNEEITTFLKSILDDENILFHHIVALILKVFPDFQFEENVYIRYTQENHRHWLVNFYMIKWLVENKKKELLHSYSTLGNHFIQRELNNYKYLLSADDSYKKIFSTGLLDSNDNLIALQGLTFMFRNFHFISNLKVSKKHNEYVKYILTNQPSDIVIHTITKEWKIDNAESFFNKSIWSNDKVLEELRNSFLIFVRSAKIDPSKALLNLNLVNNLIYDTICSKMSIVKKSSEFGSNLNANLITHKLPICNMHWTEINEKRNQRTEAHSYDKYGEIRLKITINEFKELYKKQIHTIEELCNYDWN